MENFSVLKELDALLAENLEKYSTNPLLILEDFLEKLLANEVVFPSFHSTPNRNGLVRGRFMIQNADGSKVEYFNFQCISKQESRRATMVLRDNLEDFPEGMEFEVDGEEKLLSRSAFTLTEVPGATDWYMEDFESDEVSSAKKIKSEGSPSSSQIVAKFYGEALDDLKTNTVVDVYGLWSEFHSNENDREVVNRSLHVIKYEIIGADTFTKDLSLERSDMSCIRDVLKKNLCSLLGDNSSADFLLANLLSSTYSRPDGMPICSIPVNIIGVNNAEPIISFLKCLLPMVKVLHLTPELLARPFASIKDYQENDLIQGELQLPNGTLLLIDETSLPDGPVPVAGEFLEANLKALEQIILEQRIQYDFGFYKIPFDVDYQMIILSKKRSRILKTPFIVPYVPSLTPSDAPSLSSFSGLPLARKYIQLVRKNLRSISITSDTIKLINENFVELARTLNKEVNKADLMNELLILCRIQAAAEGNPEVTEEHWKNAIKLEAERKEVLQHFDKIK